MRCNEIQDNLSAWLDGELTADLAAAVRSHIDTCADCRRLADGLRATAALLASLPARPAPEGLAHDVQRAVERETILAGAADASRQPPERAIPLRRAPWGPRALAVAATLLLTVGIGLFAFLGSDPATVPLTTTPSMAPAPAQAPATADASKAMEEPPPAPIAGWGRAPETARTPAAPAPAALYDRADRDGIAADNKVRRDTNAVPSAVATGPAEGRTEGLLRKTADEANRGLYYKDAATPMAPPAPPAMPADKPAAGFGGGEQQLAKGLSLPEARQKTAQRTRLAEPPARENRTAESGDAQRGTALGLELASNGRIGVLTPFLGQAEKAPAVVAGAPLAPSATLSPAQDGSTQVATGRRSGKAEPADLAYGHFGYATPPAAPAAPAAPDVRGRGVADKGVDVGGTTLSGGGIISGDDRAANATAAKNQPAEATKAAPADTPSFLSYNAVAAAKKEAPKPDTMNLTVAGKPSAGLPSTDAPAAAPESAAPAAGVRGESAAGSGAAAATGGKMARDEDRRGLAVNGAAAAAAAPVETNALATAAKAPLEQKLEQKNVAEAKAPADPALTLALAPAAPAKAAPPAPVLKAAASLSGVAAVQAVMVGVVQGQSDLAELKAVATRSNLKEAEHQLVLDAPSAAEGNRAVQNLFRATGWQPVAAAQAARAARKVDLSAGPTAKAADPLLRAGERLSDTEKLGDQAAPAGVYYMAHANGEDLWLVLTDRDSLSRFGNRLAEADAVTIDNDSSASFRAVGVVQNQLRKQAKESLLGALRTTPAAESERPAPSVAGDKIEATATAKATALPEGYVVARPRDTDEPTPPSGGAGGAMSSSALARSWRTTTAAPAAVVPAKPAEAAKEKESVALRQKTAESLTPAATVALPGTAGQPTFEAGGFAVAAPRNGEPARQPQAGGAGEAGVRHQWAGQAEKQVLLVIRVRTAGGK